MKEIAEKNPDRTKTLVIWVVSPDLLREDKGMEEAIEKS
jgi:hypothetical protein